ncbi:hypothetical protein BC937DRAFT_94233, partial [Endogone sp. FLAS-F59071]
HSRVINNHAPPVAELARKAEGPSAVPKKPRKAAANTAVQPAQSTDNNNSPVRSRPRDPIRILIDTPAELSAQPSNLATTAPAQSPATGSPQMVTARSPNSANGLLTGITTGRLTQPPDRNRKRLLARKAQPSGGNVSSREIHTPIGKLKGPPCGKDTKRLGGLYCESSSSRGNREEYYLSIGIHLTLLFCNHKELRYV